MQRLPLHPRLARILLDGGGAPNVAAACALMADGRTTPSAPAATTCDLFARIDRLDREPAHVQQAARDLARQAGASPGAAPVDDTTLRHAIFTGYADRLARRRPGSPDRLVLASGHGAVLGRESGVREGEFLVALDVVGQVRDGVSEASVRSASLVDPAWVEPTTRSVHHRVDPDTGRVKAVEVASVDALVVGERPVPPDPARAAEVLAAAWLARGPRGDDEAWLRRLRFAGVEVDLAALVLDAARHAASLDTLDLAASLPRDLRARVEAQAPASLPVPSGRSAPLTYGDDGTVTASVKLQELFGLAATPRLGPAGVPVTFSLLAPNGRPVQTTRDLRSFWQGAYQEIRRELRGRYPKHPWPEDPWTAVPTHRTTKGQQNAMRRR
jgi:ATP-dependent helicase HrpB